MEKLEDPFKKYNFSKTHSGNFSEGESNKAKNAQNERNIIENLICQLNNTVPKSVKDSAISNQKRQNERSFKLQDPLNLDEILTTDEALITPTSHNVSIINAACQEVLKQMEYQLTMLLKKNRKEQEIIQAFLSSNCKNISFDNPKRSCIKCAGIPYFKDPNGFQPPPNEDVLRKKKNNKLLPLDFLKSFSIWNSTDAKNLIKAVMKYDISQPSTIDWMKISVTDMEGKYSPSECKAKWTLHLNKEINKSKWSSKEMESLKTLSAKYNFQDWDKIAAELGTNRTGLQCCIQYRTHTFPTEGKWTKEEDETLKNLINLYKVKEYIPWPKVVWFFENRSLKQCQERYAYHLGNIKKGNFTMEEDFVIVYLASKLKNFGEVAKFLPKRVATQVRSRYEYLVNLSMPEFSKEEDELLTKLMVQYPRNWKKISENFENRSRVQCRKRWAHLQKKIKLEGDFESESENDECLNSGTKICNLGVGRNQIDAETVNKNIHNLSKSSKGTKRYPEIYRKLLDYHKYCHKFLFGPKPRIAYDSEDLKKLKTKMIITMKNLSISYSDCLREFNIKSLSNSCEFDNEDLLVLNELKSDEQDTREFELTKKIFPPNYMTLVALRTFTLGWDKIKTLSNFYKEVPQIQSTVSSDNRMLCSDAKKLFKSRLKSILAFPLILSNISPNKKIKLIQKPKVRKTVKPLSKRRRKEHAKLMRAAYTNKLSEIWEQTQDSKEVKKALKSKSKSYERKKKISKPDLENVGNSATTQVNSIVNGNEIRNKRKHSFKSEPEESAPLLKKRATKNSKSST